MTGHNIGGTLDLAALAALTDRDVTFDVTLDVTLERHAANRHRPQDAATIRAAIHELAARGYGDYQIAQTTQLSVDYIRRTLGSPRTSDAT